MIASPVTALSRSQQLKSATHGAHERLDQRILRGDPFASVERYRRFLRVQYRFHRDIAGLYALPAAQAVVPDLLQRQRLQDLVCDLQAVGEPLPVADAPVLDAQPRLATALGWLYVAEGSNLGAAILFKMAAKLGLDETHGARHLAGHPDGRARHWRSFTAALDAVPLDAAQEQELVAAATQAFLRVHAFVEQAFEACVAGGQGDGWRWPAGMGRTLAARSGGRPVVRAARWGAGSAAVGASTCRPIVRAGGGGRTHPTAIAAAACTGDRAGRTGRADAQHGGGGDAAPAAQITAVAADAAQGDGAVGSATAATTGTRHAAGRAAQPGSVGGGRARDAGLATWGAGEYARP